MFVYCDDPRHSKAIAVTNFQALRGPDGEWNGRWNEVYASPAAQGTRESGVTIEVTPDGDRRPEPGSLSGRGARGREFRSVYNLVCRKCKRHPVEAREEKLFAALDILANRGEFRIPLEGLAAMLRKQANRQAT